MMIQKVDGDVSMHSLTIRDLHEEGYLAVDLADILLLDKEKALISFWRCDDVECVGNQDAPVNELHDVCDQQKVISGERLLHLASSIRQIINGRFTGILPNEKNPWLIVEAVDSSFYRVSSTDNGFITKIRQRFTDVRE